MGTPAAPWSSVSRADARTRPPFRRNVPTLPVQIEASPGDPQQLPERQSFHGARMVHQHLRVTQHPAGADGSVSPLFGVLRKPNSGISDGLGRHNLLPLSGLVHWLANATPS